MANTKYIKKPVLLPMRQQYRLFKYSVLENIIFLINSIFTSKNYCAAAESVVVVVAAVSVVIASVAALSVHTASVLSVVSVVVPSPSVLVSDLQEEKDTARAVKATKANFDRFFIVVVI